MKREHKIVIKGEFESSKMKLRRDIKNPKIVKIISKLFTRKIPKECA